MTGQRPGEGPGAVAGSYGGRGEASLAPSVTTSSERSATTDLEIRWRLQAPLAGRGRGLIERGVLGADASGQACGEEQG